MNNGATKLWIDDLRPPPDDTWDWVKTSANAIATLNLDHPAGLHAISFDHDLGGDDTTRPIVLWMCENECWPEVVYVHSANPIGAEWLMGMCRRYAPAEVRVRRAVYTVAK